MSRALENPLVQIYLYCVWSSSVPLSEEVVSKLVPYLTRYAQTLSAPVLAVGGDGGGGRLQLLVQLPGHLSVDSLMGQLQPPVARYANTALGTVGLTWTGVEVVSVSLGELDAWRERISAGEIPAGFGNLDGEDGSPSDEGVPDWLQEMLTQTPKS